MSNADKSYTYIPGYIKKLDNGVSEVIYSQEYSREYMFSWESKGFNKGMWIYGECR